MTTCAIPEWLGALGAGLILAATAVPALAGLTRDELASVGFSAVAGDPLPTNVPLNDAKGETSTLGERLDGRPGLIAFVDYTCETVCGVAANALAAAEAGMKGDDLDHRVFVVGFDARDTDADRAAWLAGNRDAAALGGSAFLAGGPEETAALVGAAGLRTVYDPEHDQFAHPAGSLLIDTQGRILRSLDLVSLQPDTLRSALIEASNGTAGTFVERAILSCYGWDAETGRYRPLIDTTLIAACVTTAAATAAFVGAMLLRDRRRAADASRPETSGGRDG